MSSWRTDYRRQAELRALLAGRRFVVVDARGPFPARRGARAERRRRENRSAERLLGEVGLTPEQIRVALERAEQKRLAAARRGRL